MAEKERILTKKEWEELRALDAKIGERAANAILNEMKFPLGTIAFRVAVARNLAAETTIKRVRVEGKYPGDLVATMLLKNRVLYWRGKNVVGTKQK